MLRYLLIFLIWLPVTAIAEVTVLVSIKPLALLANQLVAPEDRVELLITGSRSPHHYQLTINDRRRIQDANLVLWIGPTLETFLEKPLKQRSQGVVTAMNLAGIQWPTNHQEKHQGHDHDHGDKDPHLWLNPKNAIVIINKLATELSALAPSRADYYQARAEKLQAELNDLDQRLQQLLIPVREQPFVVLHPAYDHFVDRYQLNQQHYIAITPERGVGAKHLYQLRQLKPVCAFAEEGQSAKLADNIAKATGAKVQWLDPLGIALVDDAGATALIDKLAVAFVNCLSPAGH